jgi:hypothetical protein
MKRCERGSPGNLQWCRNLLLAGLMISGCAHTQLRLPGADQGEKGEAVRVTQRSKVALLFHTDRVDSTKVRVGDTFECAWVNVVESDRNHLLLKSKQWNTVTDIPATYLQTKEIFVTSRHPKFDRPTVRIPLSAVKEIWVLSERRHGPDLSARWGSVGKWALKGASVGFVSLLTLLSEEVDSEDALVVGVIGALGGATLNTGYHLFRPEEEKIRSIYRRSGNERWEYVGDIDLER